MLLPDSMPRSATSSNDAPAVTRGRPRVLPYSVDEVAELLCVEPEMVVRALGSRFRGDFFPHAFEKDGAWWIPPRDLRALLGPGLPRPFWVSEFAELIGFSVPYVNELIRKGVIKTRMILGSTRVPATQFWELPEHRPAGLRKRPKSSAKGAAAPAALSFFSEEDAAA